MEPSITPPTTVAGVVTSALRAAGVGVVLGEPFGYLAARPCAAPLSDVLLRGFHRTGATRATYHRGDGTFTFAGGSGADIVTVDRPELVGPAIYKAATAPGGTPSAIRVDVDPAAPASLSSLPPAPTWGTIDTAAADAIARAEAPLGLVGPGILESGHVAGLRTFAAVANLGVFNTWGAKGVFHWQSRHHLATIGLQRDDFSLGGFGEADLIVTSGVDEAEAPPGLWRLAPVVEIAPIDLAATSEAIHRAASPIAFPAIRTRLADATAAGWSSTARPLPPSLLTRVYGEAVGGDGLVSADPGLAGFFVARTQGTTTPGGVLVPSDAGAPGFAVAAALAAGVVTPWRRALAVTTGQIDDVTSALLDLAAGWDVPISLDVWSGEGVDLDADEHHGRLATALGAATSTTRVAVDRSQYELFVEAAGPKVAWPDIEF